MERIAVFVNDAEHAREVLLPLQHSGAPTHWTLAACPPPLTRHAGRWLSKAAHQAWIERWSAQVFAQLSPLLLATAGSRVETMLVKRTVRGMAERLARQHGPLRVFDARRARLGQVLEPLDASSEPSALNRWTGPVGATAGLSSLLLLAD
jgi:hypothetical protein